MRQVGHAVVGIGARVLAIEDIDVVAADTPQDLGHALCNFCPFTQRYALQAADDIANPAVFLHAIQTLETPLRAIRQDGVDGCHVVHHIAVLNRPGTAGIIARHAANGALGRS